MGNGIGTPITMPCTTALLPFDWVSRRKQDNQRAKETARCQSGTEKFRHSQDILKPWHCCVGKLRLCLFIPGVLLLFVVMFRTLWMLQSKHSVWNLKNYCIMQKKKKAISGGCFLCSELSVALHCFSEFLRRIRATWIYNPMQQPNWFLAMNLLFALYIRLCQSVLCNLTMDGRLISEFSNTLPKGFH